jgi:hypothetical protein
VAFAIAPIGYAAPLFMATAAALAGGAAVSWTVGVAPA